MIPSPWILFPQPNPQADIRLFCFSHAGAGASIFRPWAALMASTTNSIHIKATENIAIEVCAVQRPGRENRLSETPYRNVTALVHQMHPQLLPYLDRPFVCFGHSVGALICFEWMRYLQQQRGPLPLALFVSSRQAPQIPVALPWTHTLSRNDLLSELRNYGGTPEAVLQSREFMDLYLPILRADLAVHESYAYSPAEPLPMPISAFGGLQDSKVSKASLQAWAEQTTQDFRLRLFPGGHLFIKDSAAEILRAIAQDISFRLTTHY